MSLVLGIDPGLSGALVLIDPARHEIVACHDMPVVTRTVGRGKRSRMDMVALDGVLAELTMACDLVTLEDPGARPAQAGAMAFGIGVGIIKHALHVLQVRVEEIVPRVWKAKLRVPKDKEEATLRAEELFPIHRHLFRGPKGGKLDGRAEAAMIALFGAQAYL